MLIDTHCHLQFNAYKDDVEDVIKRCNNKQMILNVVGTQKDTSEQAVQLAEKYDNIYATVGLHPIHTTSTEVDEEEITFKSREEVFDYEFYKALASHPKVIAIGECGMELFHKPADADRKAIIKKHSESFLLQAKLARELDLPMVIHVRDAYEEMAEVLGGLRIPPLSPPSQVEDAFPPYEGGNKGGVRGVIHCFTGNWSQAQKFLDLGMYLGFTGVITFPPRKTNPQPTLELLEVVKNCPLDRILTETDAPYLAPQKYRGERAEPWMVEEVVKKIAEMRWETVANIQNAITENTLRLFRKIKIPRGSTRRR
ncbi:MAG: TatD family hydrolase [Candidatus Magasanikbacteria bacterium]|nr:TatD family hydrolase [Candidatus Magasanikbacteria bacterium]